MAFKIQVLSAPPRTIEAAYGESLSQALLKAGFPLNVYCGGKGICGKCLAEVVDGTIPPPDQEEAALLRRAGAGPRFRLACLLPVRSDLVVKIPANALLPRIQGLTAGILPSFDFDPAVKKFLVSLDRDRLSPPLLEAGVADLLKLPPDDAWRRDSWPLVREAIRSAGREPKVYTAAVYEEKALLDFAPGESSDEAFGLAVDLGTTTVVVELVDLVGGRILGKAFGLNGQSRFGADVISRISHAILTPSHAEELKEAALETLSGLLARAAAEAKIAPESIYDIAVAGNTAMNHFLLGRSVRTLSVAPFEAEFQALPPLEAYDCGFRVQRRAKLFISPNIGSYVGGDITEGLLATGLLNKPGHYLFIDIGTNGEIVLKAGDRFTAASTAAGPAFEGASLSCGMLAVPGAVDRAVWSDGALSVTTIGNRPPAGICGTGYIDLLACFLREGLISRNGVIAGGKSSIAVAAGIAVSQKDIRELQLAVAAVRTGVELLLRRHGLSPRDLDGLYLAGAFGNYLDIENGRAIGLLPEINLAKVRFVGNASLAGARAMLLSRRARSEAVRIAETVDHVPLAADAAFQDIYIRSLVFPEPTIPSQSDRKEIP
ncbi:MAG: ASKHA domain-containing protein [Candidatus Aminicenantes bacterium]|nr:ASKHA domain-containing protein [Candidatus Aminicenantes bacterium]